MTGGATFDATRKYRYRLWRDWSDESPSSFLGSRVCWILLNPSTADERVIDPTVRRCLAFSRAWGGVNALDVVNVYALRSTDPAVLRRKIPDPTGGSVNEDVIIATALNATRVVCGWGNHGGAPAAKLLQALRDLGITLYTFGLTKKGEPRHPLYVPLSASLEVLA